MSRPLAELTDEELRRVSWSPGDDRISELLERYDALAGEIAVRMTGPCGSPGNEHMWVMVTDRNNVPRTVCAKCGATP